MKSFLGLVIYDIFLGFGHISVASCNSGRVGDWKKRDLDYLAAATAAKSPQSCPTLRDPIDGSPLGSSVHGILQARTLEWVAISSSNA